MAVSRQHLYPSLHLWMLLPLFVAIGGFYFTYWSVFSQVPFHQHVHSLTATAWYVLLVVQPWLHQRGNMALHRKVGIVGLFLAGGVVFSVLQVIQNNMTNERISDLLRYGFTWGDFLFLAGFSYSVIMALWNSKNMSLHGRYMVASALWALLPALSRLLYFPLLAMFGSPPVLSFISALYLGTGLGVAIVVLLVVVDFRKDRRVYPCYLQAGVGMLLFAVTFQVFGDAPWWREFCQWLLGPK